MLSTLLVSTLATAALAAPTVEKRGGPVTLPLRTKYSAPARVPTLNQENQLWFSNFAKQQGNGTGTVPEISVDVIAGWQEHHYYVDLEVGTPKQKLEVVMDTGSSDLLVYSALCPKEECAFDTSRGHQGFNPNTSSTFKWLEDGPPVDHYFGGGERSSGHLGKDTVRIGDINVDNYRFTVIQNSNQASRGMNVSGSGIVGLGWAHRNEGSNETSLTRFINGHQQSQEFGLYFGRMTNEQYASKQAVVNSELTIGGLDESKFDGSVSYAKLATFSESQTPDRWMIGLDGANMNDKVFQVGEKQANLAPGDKYDPFISSANIALVDSGAPLILMPSDIFKEFHEAIPGNRYVAAYRQYQIPCNSTNVNLTFTIGNEKFDMYWADFMLPVNSQAEFCWTLASTRAPGTNLYGWILGTPFLHNVYSAYRYAPEPAVGFAKLKPEFNIQTNQLHPVSDLTGGDGSADTATNLKDTNEDATSGAHAVSVSLSGLLGVAFVTLFAMW